MVFLFDLARGAFFPALLSNCSSPFPHPHTVMPLSTPSGDCSRLVQLSLGLFFPSFLFVPSLNPSFSFTLAESSLREVYVQIADSSS